MMRMMKIQDCWKDDLSILVFVIGVFVRKNKGTQKAASKISVLNMHI